MKEIDILIPVIEKDLIVLPHVIDSARENVRHPIGQILVVAPESEKIKELCDEKDCLFIDEDTVLPITKYDIDYCPKIKGAYLDRSGWLFQQLLKLSGDTLCSSNSYLVLDADTVLIKPHKFEHNGKSVFYCRRHTYWPYFRTYRKLLGESAIGPDLIISFVNHYMLLNKKRLGELKQIIEARHNTDWYSAIINCIDKNDFASFSEFETYGNFMLKRYPDQIILKHWRNLKLGRRDIENFSDLSIKELARKYRAISFHSYRD